MAGDDEMPEMAAGQTPDFFLLQGPDGALRAASPRARLAPGPIATLAARSAAFLAAADGPGLLVGAVPYDRAAEDCLHQPARVDTTPRRFPPAAFGGEWRVEAIPPAADYRAAVAAALERLDVGGPLRKVVLSRSLAMTCGHDIPAAALLAGLGRDPAATLFSVALPERQPGQPRRLLGATPELLLSRRGRAVASHPLAGSARRRADPARDRAAGEALLASAKDRREHEMVVEAVLDALAPHCRELGAPKGTTLRATATMWHLGTRIEGILRDGAPAAELLAALHPTPAVCGLPREPADILLRQLEGHDRGFYAGAVGWLDAAGDGEWHVALRCAEIEGPRLTMWAGAGIVPGSDPEGETAETSAKFLAMLGALGIDEDGHPLHGRVA